MQRINDKALLNVSGEFHDEASRATAASVRPSENKYPPRITGDPSGIVKRKAGRDNSIGVERGFCACGEMARWPSAHIYLRREQRDSDCRERK